MEFCKDGTLEDRISECKNFNTQFSIKEIFDFIY